MSSAVLVEPPGVSEDASYLRIESSDIKTEYISNCDIPTIPLPNKTLDHSGNVSINGLKNKFPDNLTETPDKEKLVNYQKTDGIMGQSLPKVNGVSTLMNVKKVLSSTIAEDSLKSVFIENGPTNEHDCENSIDSNDDLSEPNSNTSQDKPYRCHMCDKLFSRNSSLKCHIRLHLEGPENILRSASTQPTNSFQKTSDPLVINNNNEEKESIVIPAHLLKEQTQFGCVLCDNHFTKMSALKHHIIECHVTADQMDESATRRNSTENESSPCNADKEYACVICDQRFSRKSSLIMHYKNHPIEKSKNEISVEDLPKFTVDIIESNHLVEPFLNEVKCSSVRKQFLTSKKVDVTNKVDDKPYKCYVCDKQFARNSSLVWHIQFHETNLYSKSNKSEVFENEDTEYTCRNCNKRFESKIAFKKHIQCHKCDIELETSVAAANDESTPLVIANHKNTLPDENGLYQCEICPKLFTTCRAKNIHSAHAHRSSSMGRVDGRPSTITASNDASYECHLCDRAFETPRGLYRHMGYHNSRDQMAPKADDSSSDIDLSLDVLDVDEPETKTTLKKRLLNTDDMFECDYCQKSFTSSRAKNIHRSHAHRELSEVSDLHDMDEDDEDEEEAENVETEPEEFQCYECDRVFSSKRARSIHALQIHLEANSDETFGCPLCERFFFSSRALHIHSSSQHKGEDVKPTTPIKPEVNTEFQCKFCKRVFDSSRAMNIHISAQHRNEGPRTCDVCEKSFESSSHLRNHLQGVCGTAQLVDGKILYFCRVCQKSFSHPKSMFRHVRDHKNAEKTLEPEINESEEEREFKCPFCAKSFANVKSLAGHVKIHPRTPGDIRIKFEPSTPRIHTEPFSKHSVTKTEVFVEKVTNSETKIYTCVFCKRYFNSSTGYAGHMKAHKGQLLRNISPIEKQIKPETEHKMKEEVEEVTEFICNDCGERFFLKKDLSRHMRIHVISSNTPLNESSVLCLYCKRPFNSEQSLRTHMYKFHRSKIIPLSGGASPMAAEKASLKVEGKQLTCDLCRQSFDYYKELRRHSMLGCNGLPIRKRSIGDTLKCEYCGQTFLLHCHLAKHLKSRCNAVDLCNDPLRNAEKYDEGFTPSKRARKSTFISSMYEYDSVTYHKCDECGKTCSNKKALLKHLVSHKITPSRLKFSFRKNGDMVSAKQHTTALAQFRDKPYECIYCEKCFGEKTLLLEHVRTHAEANELDEAEFEKYISLHAGEHFVVQNLEGDEEHFIFEEHGDDEGYQCTECKETYHDKLQMIIHMTHHLNSKLHNGGHKSLLIKADATLLAPYKCSFCQERFINKKYRMQHLRKHHNEDIMHCDVCGNLFLHKKNLRIHCKQHNVDTKYKCEFCHKCFTSKWFLKRHARRQCGKKPSPQIEVPVVFKIEKEQEGDPLSITPLMLKEELVASQVIMFD